MKQGIFTIESNSPVAASTFRLTLLGDTSACQRAGQFADVALEGRFLRRPLAVTWWEQGRMSLVYKVVGEGTEELSKMQPGRSLDVLTGLGNGFDISLCKESALIVCGGLGASPVFSLAESLLSAGRKVSVIMGFNNCGEVFLDEEFAALGADVTVATMDGSKGCKGLVTDALARVKPVFDVFYCCGPKVMMKAVCDALEGPGQVSLEERMGCGCGICYGCTCHTTKGARRICADGPVFNREEVIW